MRTSAPAALLLCCALVAALAPSARAQEGGEGASGGGASDRRQHRAARLAGEAPRIDGRLDDAAWAGAPVLDGFRQKLPVEGVPADERTEVRFLYDDEYLYVGARMHAADPSRIRAPVTRRDNGQGDTERLTLSLDTYRDRRTAYTFGVSAAGTRFDWYQATDQEHDRDLSWDPVWEAEASVDSAGWTAEMRIPFSQLRFNARDEQVWGINLNRWSPGTNRDDYWVLIPRSETGWASRFGELRGIRGIRPARRVEVMPYVASDVRLAGRVDPDDPFAERREAGARVGADLRVGLGPSLTLEATINPDFGQVEADPAEVNLSAFESFFSERRPFFTEANRLLRIDGPGYFYSRRVGARPRLSTGADYDDYPDGTTILGAAKLTGRVAAGTTVGVLAAVTDEEHARTFTADGGGFGRLRVAPRTAYAVSRVQQEVGGQGSTVGLLLTGVRRDLEEGSPLEALLPRTAVTGGADWNLRFRDGEYVVDGSLGFSRVAGDSLALLRIQNAPAHYFGRPDADHVALDSSRTSLSGYTASLGVSREAGEHWLWRASASAESPGLELNDVGRLSTAGDLAAFAELEYRETQPGPVFRDYSVELTTESLWDYAGVRSAGGVGLELDATWASYWSTALSGWVDLRAQSPTLTRGGPRMGTGRGWSVAGRLSNHFAAATRWSAEASYGRNELGGRRLRLETGISARPSPRWRLSVDPEYERATDARQYVATLEDEGPAATFGDGYVFAFIDRSELSAQLRVSYSFTPDLSLETYAEPFVASGRFRRFGQLPEPGSRALDFFAPGVVERTEDGAHLLDGETLAEDFHVRSFRSNAVLRWDWRPGSTLFVVWQQDRGAEAVGRRHVRPGDLLETLRTTGDNYLALKVTYWLPV